MQAKPEINLCRAGKRQARIELFAVPSVRESVTLINTRSAIPDRNRNNLTFCTRQKLVIYSMNPNLVTDLQGENY